jgi:hypothetical protein
MGARLICEYEVNAGGGWNGHVWFMVTHPITKKSLRTNFIQDVVAFCEKNNLCLDPEIYLIIMKLDFSEKYGHLVPLEHIEKNAPWSSASKYLKEIKKDLQIEDFK